MRSMVTRGEVNILDRVSVNLANLGTVSPIVPHGSYFYLKTQDSINILFNILIL